LVYSAITKPMSSAANRTLINVHSMSPLLSLQSW